jgi:hypothetical protein
MGPEQVLSISLNWYPCSEPAELWVSLWVFQPADCGIRLLPNQRQESPQPGPGIHFPPEFCRCVSPDRTGAETARRRCRPEQESTMRFVPFDAPVPEWSPGGSYGHS